MTIENSSRTFVVTNPDQKLIITKSSFYWLWTDKATLGTRIKLALALMVTPITLILFGHSPRIELKYRPPL